MSASITSSLSGDFDMSYDVDSLLDFDFDFSEISEDDVSLAISEATSVESTVESVEAPQPQIVVVDEAPKVNHKPNKSVVSKIKKKPTTKKNGTSTLKSVIKGGKVPNISRRVQGSVLCAFPTFDKCDSLVFLPHSISRFMNNGDITGMAALLQAHTSKNCEVHMKGMEMMLDGFLYLNELITELHPDTVSCVNTTKVVGNSIMATVFTKYTDSNSIFDCVARTKKGQPMFDKIFGSHPCGDRSQRMAHKIEPITNKTEEEKAQMLTVCSTAADIVIYANYYMKFTFDDATHKVTHINFDFELTSLTSAQDAALGRR